MQELIDDELEGHTSSSRHLTQLTYVKVIDSDRRFCHVPIRMSGSSLAPR